MKKNNYKPKKSRGLRKNDEEELKRSREFLDNIINALDDPVFVKDEQHRWVILNDTACELMGQRREELVGKTDYDLFPKEQADVFWEKDNLVLQTQKTNVSEEQITWHNKLHTISTKKSVFTDSLTGKKFIAGTIRDITERKQMEQELLKANDELETKVQERTCELKAANEQLRKEITERKQAREALAYEKNLLYTLMDNIPDKIYFKDTENRFVRISKWLADCFELSEPAEAVGKTDFDFFAEECARQWYEDEKKILETGQPLIGIEEKETWPDGRSTWASTTKVPLRDNNGQIIGTVGISRDITECKLAQEAIQKAKDELEIKVQQRTSKLRIANERLKKEIAEREQAQEALQASEKRYHSLYSSMDSGVALHELIYNNSGKPVDYKILDVNPAFEKITGIKREKAIGAMGSELYGTGQAPHIEVYAKAAESGQAVSFETTFEPMKKVFNISVFTPEKGKFATIFSNITTRKLAEQARDKLNRELEVKNKELESILYVASHDLRSPLINIQGFSHELSRSCQQVRSSLDDNQMDEQTQTALVKRIPEALGFILTSANKMDSLLSGLLRLSRVGRAAMTIKPLDMNAMLANVLGSMEYQVKEAGARVEIEPLPPCLGDALQINQVFSNLLDNAIKYLDESRAGVIHIYGRVEDGQNVYCVEDNSAGIAPGHQHKIFEIFHRLEPNRISGEGLGLTIVRRILDRHNGKVWVESEPGKGSKFFVSLPSA